MSRSEFIVKGNCEPAGELAPGVILRVFAAGALGAEDLTTCSATIAPNSGLPYHAHPTSEVITAMVGTAEVLVEGRRYLLHPYDAIHVPAGVAHSVTNPLDEGEAILHTSFPTSKPDREFVEDTFELEDREQTDESCPETLIRFTEAVVEFPLDGVEMRDLFAGRFGSQGVCGGHVGLQPGAALPCHTCQCDVSFTIVDGQVISQTAGSEQELANFDSVCIPGGRPFRIINRTDAPASLLWAYAADEPDRTDVDPARCDPVA